MLLNRRFISVFCAPCSYENTRQSTVQEIAGQTWWISDWTARSRTHQGKNYRRKIIV